MGTFTGSVQLRDAALASTASVIAAFNRIEEAILGCGMLRATPEEDPGQVGVFVEGAPSTGQTQIPASSSAGYNYIGYKTYKLPDSLAAESPLYVRCFFYPVSASGLRVALATFSVKIGDSAWTPVIPNSVVSGLYVLASTSSTALGVSHIATEPVALRAACGEGYFHLTVMAGTPTSGTALTYLPVSKLALVGVCAVRAFKDGVAIANAGAHISPCLINSLSSGFYSQGSTSPSTIEVGSTNSPVGALCTTVADSIWSPIRAGVLQAPADDSITFTDGGIRAQVPQLVIGNKQLELPMAVAGLAAAPADGATLDVPLWGLDTVRCIVSHAFIRAGRDQFFTGPSGQRPGDSSILLLPWED